MDLELDDTICAIATPMGEGGIGILRISGEKALTVASTVVRLRSGRALDTVQSHHLYRADLLWSSLQPQPTQTASQDRVSRVAPQGPLDEALVVVMRGPHSYTGENVVELHCHGGPLVLQVLCESVIRNGGRLACPGEFTKRAFLSGRLDLTQAEAARQLRLSPHTLRRWRHEGRGPTWVQIGGAIRYAQEALDRFVALSERSHIRPEVKQVS